MVDQPPQKILTTFFILGCLTSPKTRQRSREAWGCCEVGECRPSKTPEQSPRQEMTHLSEALFDKVGTGSSLTVTTTTREPAWNTAQLSLIRRTDSKDLGETHQFNQPVETDTQPSSQDRRRRLAHLATLSQKRTVIGA